MSIAHSEINQDSLQIKNVFLKDSAALKTDSAITAEPDHLMDSVIIKVNPVIHKAEHITIDTTAICSRSKVADITFADSNNIVTSGISEPYNKFPYIFIEKTRQKQVDARAYLEGHLNPGKELPKQELHDDWIIGIILIPAFLYSLISTTSKNLLPLLSKFFLFRGINDPSSRDIGGLFHWQSTIQNLISFLITGLFAYSYAVHFDIMPPGIHGIVAWLIAVGILIVAITIRHFICSFTGSISGEKEVFREYLVIIYQSYRFSSLLLYIIIILLLYTKVLPADFFFISGIIVLSIMYIIRILRLLTIFITRKISIFYMILYLCALEIMPVLISVKYFTGLF